ncbi:MAG TPA: hypothetical protein VIL85_01890 [Thermomicrobiales bacterium]|jgi:hypothetical protein
MPPTASAAPTTQEAAEVARLTATLTTLGLRLRPDDRWHAVELAMVAEALADLLRAARWSPAACLAALGGPITILRDRSGPITTDAAGTRYPVLGLYDTAGRLLTVNDWSFDARVGGEANGRRILLHELAHAWDHRASHLLSLGIGWLPGPRASGYARSSRFEDWAEAVMGAVYGADPGHEAFERTANGRPSWRLRYVRWAFARYRRAR